MESSVGIQKGKDGNSLCITPRPWWRKILLQGSWDSRKGLESSLLLLIAHPHHVAPEIPSVWCIDISDIPFEVGQRAHASSTAWIHHWAWKFLDASNSKVLSPQHFIQAVDKFRNGNIRTGDGTTCVIKRIPYVQNIWFMQFTKTSYYFELTHFWCIWVADISHRRILLKTLTNL